MFFDDLRARSVSERASSNASTRDGDVAYDFDSGVYRDAQGSTMGQRNQDLELARNISRPSALSGSSAYAARSVGDYTNYSGQYTTPTGFFAPTYTSDPFLSGKRNLKVGPVNVGFGLYQGVEYNDNINRAPNGASDIITTTMLSINANYRVTQNNTLSISTAVGFDKYWEHPELSPYGGGSGFVLNVLPGSTIAYDIKAGPVNFTLYNRFSVRPAARSTFALSQNQTFGVFQNDTGLAANWRINSDWSLALNYMHSIANSLSTVGNNADGTGGQRPTAFNRTTDSLQGSLTYSPNGTWTAGLEGGITKVNYETQFNNDGNLFNLGAFIVMPLGKSTYVRAAAGSQVYSFGQNGSVQNAIDSQAAGLGIQGNEAFFNQFARTGDQNDLNDFYYSVTLSNTLNSRVSQALTLGHESSLNLTSNYITSDYINYGISMIAWRGSKISLSGYFENAEASGGLHGQNIQQHGFDLYVAHRINSRVQFGAGYHYGFSDVEAQQAASNITNSNDFTQHAFNVDFTYTLSAKSTLNFGYRHYVTTVENGTGNFSQNRLTLGYNYNF
ncbi:MAG: hypothetical protein NTV80_03675 [Verrucomicrobia bacterium]|nr:hypothetical protein [Verrucomicrobiota bacterium]